MIIPAAAVLAIALFLLTRLIRRFAFRRCTLYLYTRILWWRVPVMVGFVKRDGTIIDTTRPFSRRRVGQVTCGEDRAVVHLYRTRLGDGQEVDVGYVLPDGNVFEIGDTGVGEVEPEGCRKWWEFFLRRHSYIPPSGDLPWGKVVESRRPGPRVLEGEVTLLAQGGAALILYRLYGVWVQSARRSPRALWDTALLAALLFSALFMMPGAVAFLKSHVLILPWLPGVGYVATGIALFAAIWILLHILKILMCANDDSVLDYLDLINRQTGLEFLGWLGFISAIICFVLAMVLLHWTYLPMFFAMIIAFGAATLFAPGEPWPTRGRNRENIPPQATTEGEETRTFRWKLDSLFRDLVLQTEVRFKTGEIAQVRDQNPFWKNASDAAARTHEVAEEIVKASEKQDQPRAVAAYLANTAVHAGLSLVEELQAGLDFVQEPNIQYALDADCEELKGRGEYFRQGAETLYDTRGDCDCKAILAATLFRLLGFPVLLLVSGKAKHAAVAVGGAPLEQSEGLFFLEHDGQRYYYCETTGAGWTIGQPPGAATVMARDPACIVDLTRFGSSPTTGEKRG